ncbi:histone acetyltransferase type B catalytic subunit [Toxorhynchites rutilus septentrionalis]|uniref:histone acetyltransferase type B catalytic subunit n=1 Tax=Toxorhynchites rutilus septentrionalis TaxID=329112 RepID=UPI0024791048|nr:histone acetyltransferase type B catalytic subunit [Toxorhynchites rutilus septentrionalis]
MANRPMRKAECGCDTPIEMSSIKELQHFVSCALRCLRFRFIREDDDFEDESVVFYPVMAHQVFGSEESIFGYQDLKVDICFAAGSMDMYFNMTYSKKIEDVNSWGIKADDVEKLFASLVEDGCYYTNLEEYKKVIKPKIESFKPFGVKIDEFKVNPEPKKYRDREFEVYASDVSDKEFLKFHARMESLSFFYIDAFSRVDHDPLWLFLMIYEKYTDSNDEMRYGAVGFVSIYNFFAYPNSTRPRVSQIFIMPPFQNLGIGTRLIETTIHNYFVNKKEIADITYEEPTDVVQYIRSVVDAKRCKTLPAFSKKKLLKGFSKEMLSEAKESFKINPKHCRVIYEILRLRATNTENPEEYRSYRLEVKKRLNSNYCKHRRDLERLQKRGLDMTGAFNAIPPVEERMEQLDAEYKELEKVYYKVLKKIKKTSKPHAKK